MTSIGFTKVTHVTVDQHWTVETDGECITYTATGPGEATIHRSPPCDDHPITNEVIGTTIKYAGTTVIVTIP